MLVALNQKGLDRRGLTEDIALIKPLRKHEKCNDNMVRRKGLHLIPEKLQNKLQVCNMEVLSLFGNILICLWRVVLRQYCLLVN